MNKLKRAIGVSHGIERPNFCVIEVSHKCMFRCRMCNYWQAKPDSNEVNIEELSKFISSLKKFINTPFEMNISGGETLLKEGIINLVDFIAQQGIRFSLVTNGYLINKLSAKRIADSGLNFLAISLDSLDEHTHDYLRGIKGAHKKVMEALEYFIAYKGKLQNLTLQTIIMEPNIDGILDLVNWADEKRISLSFMAVTRPNMVPIDSAWHRKEEFSFLWPKDISKTQNVIDTLIKLKDKGCRIDNPIGQLERFKLYFLDPEKFVRETPCNLGNTIIHVNPKGEIYICCEMEPIGNINESDISEIWNSQQAENVREKIKLCKRNCAGMVNCYREAF